MFENMPLWQPMTSILLSTFSITAMTFSYLALGQWMQQYNVVLAIIMLVSAIVLAVPIVTHHIICGLLEWFFVRLGRTDEVCVAVLELQKKTIATMKLRGCC